MNQSFKPWGQYLQTIKNFYNYYENKYDNTSSTVKTLFVFGNDLFFMQLAKKNDNLVFLVGHSVRFHLKPDKY